MDLSQFPRVPLAHLPTPLEPMDRLRNFLDGPNLWIKRDDCTGLGGGGNKTRKLEFLLADALDQGVTRIVTFGAIQSNHVRQTCAAAARLGLRCDVILIDKVAHGEPAYRTSGNILLDQLFGAYVHIVPDNQASMLVYSTLQQEASENGEKLYAIPVGGSNAVGALGYAAAVPELLYQAAAMDVSATTIVHGTSSAGTQAGLLAGLRASDKNTRVIGINVSDPDPTDMIGNVLSLANEVAEMIHGKEVMADDVVVNSENIGPGYGIPTEEMIASVQMVAELEGILLDPVYSGKAMAGLIKLIRDGAFHKDDTVIFLHTGGMPSLFAYQQALVDGAQKEV